MAGHGIIYKTFQAKQKLDEQNAYNNQCRPLMSAGASASSSPEANGLLPSTMKQEPKNQKINSSAQTTQFTGRTTYHILPKADSRGILLKKTPSSSYYKDKNGKIIEDTQQVQLSIAPRHY